MHPVISLDMSRRIYTYQLSDKTVLFPCILGNAALWDFIAACLGRFSPLVNGSTEHIGSASSYLTCKNSFLIQAAYLLRYEYHLVTLREELV